MDSFIYRVQKVKTLFLFLLPHHALSRLVYWTARFRHLPFRRFITRWFIRHYHVDMSEALEADPAAYTDFNSFFTRALRPEIRPIVQALTDICCPVDGTISQLGGIQGADIFQAKGNSYSLVEILGGSEERAEPYSNGQFATMYLCPSDYHRIHMPIPGRLLETIYIPGRLFSVAPVYTKTIAHLFTRNERVVCIFETTVGPMAVILVGAIFVGSIETVWSGEITPSQYNDINVTSYIDDSNGIQLDRGEELGRFNMGGSTVIVLFAKDCVKWQEDLVPERQVKFGQALGHIDEQSHHYN